MRERIRQFWKAYGVALIVYSFGSLVGGVFIWLGIVLLLGTYMVRGPLEVLLGGIFIVIGGGIFLGMAGKILKDHTGVTWVYRMAETLEQGIFGILTIFSFIAIVGIVVLFVLWMMGIV